MCGVVAAGGNTRTLQPFGDLRKIQSSRQLSVGCTASESEVPSRLSVAEAVQTSPYVQRFASGRRTSFLASTSSTQVSPDAPAAVTMPGFLSAATVPPGSAAQREA